MKFLPPKPLVPYGMGYLTKERFDLWYAKEIAPLFENAVEVECSRTIGNHLGSWYASENGCAPKSHKALLIKIQPLKEESAEDILRELVGIKTDYTITYSPPAKPGEDIFTVIDRARAFLAKLEGK